VHTPGFDPEKCDPADVAYDATYCAAHPPARFGNVSGNCTFKGLILADTVNKLAGSGSLIGALVVFSDTDTTWLGAGSHKTLYSCQAINEFVGGKVNHKLAWERM